MEYNHVQRMKIVFKIKIYHETKLLICNEFVVVESIVCTPNTENKVRSNEYFVNIMIKLRLLFG